MLFINLVSVLCQIVFIDAETDVPEIITLSSDDDDEEVKKVPLQVAQLSSRKEGLEILPVARSVTSASKELPTGAERGAEAASSTTNAPSSSSFCPDQAKSRRVEIIPNSNETNSKLVDLSLDFGPNALHKCLLCGRNFASEEMRALHLNAEEFQGKWEEWIPKHRIERPEKKLKG